MPIAVTPPADTKPQPPFTIAVVGGGIGGLCLAVGLLRHGVPFHIYEGAPAFSEIGAGVGLGPNARRAMSLIDPRVKAGYDKFATTNTDPAAKGHFFQFRMGMDGRSETNRLKSGEKISAPGGGEEKGISMIHRARFLDELVNLIPEECVTFGKRLVKVEEKQEDRGGVKLYFEDGSVADASAAIGCDGVKSRVRQSLFGDEHEPTFTGKYAYRGMFPMAKAIELFGETQARNSQGYIGYNGHVLTMPVELGTTMNVIAVHTSPDGQWHEPRWVLPLSKESMMRDFAGWSDDVQNILRLMEKPDLWALFDHGKPVPYLWQGRICLMGDAAHASTPHQGAGAGMALEDAYVLSHLLGQVRSADDLEPAFAAYNHVRHPRDMKLVSTSRQCGDVYNFLADGIGDDVEKIDADLSKRYNWVWDEDLESELTQALEFFGKSREKRPTKGTVLSAGLAPMRTEIEV